MQFKTEMPLPGLRDEKGMPVRGENKMKTTIEDNKSLQIPTILKGLKKWEILFFELRSDGNTYLQASDKLKVQLGFKISSAHLRELLSTEGRLRPAFDAYSEITATESLSEGIRMRRNAHHLAVSTNIALLGKKYKDEVRLNASKYIQDRNEGRVGDGESGGGQTTNNTFIQNNNVNVLIQTVEKLPKRDQKKIDSFCEQLIKDDA